MKKMKKIYLLIAAILLIAPSSALASDTVSNTSELQRMTSTCLADVITSEDQVVINDMTPSGKMLEFSVSDRSSDDEIIKVIVENYNKDVFLGIIGHDVIIDQSLTDDQNLLNELNARSKYLVQAYNGDLLSSYDFDLTYDQLQIEGNKAKALITRKIVFQTNFDNVNEITDTLLQQKEGYVLEKTSDGDWKLVNIIFDTLGFSNIAMDNLAAEDSPDVWIEDYAFEELQRDQYEDTKTFTDRVDENGEIHLEDFVSPSVEKSAAYDKVEAGDSDIVALNSYTYLKSRADEYAEMYGDNPNPDYWYFYLNGECTNFVSQAIHYAGMPMSNYWWYTDRFDYSTSWTVVNELRDFIMNYTLSEGVYQDLPDYPNGVGHQGTVVQFSNGTSWSHSAICRMFYDGWLFVAEHSGAEGNVSYRMMTQDLSNMRSFWIAKG